MSLFGNSSEDDGPLGHSASGSKSSLFTDKPTLGANSSSSLFADDGPGGDDAPWGLPAPKRAARHELVKSLLPASDVPESYIDSYDLLLESGQRVGAGVRLTAIKKILSSSGVSAGDQSRILGLVIPGEENTTNGLGRGEVSVLLALVGLAQQGEDLTLDTVDDWRKRLPQPKIPYFEQLRSERENKGNHVPQPERAITPPPSSSPKETNSSRPRRMRQDSLDPEVDPWASPDLHRGHNHSQGNGSQPSINGFSGRDTFRKAPNGIRNHSEGQPQDSSNIQSNDAPPSSSGSGWDSYNNASRGSFGNSGQSGLGGFGQSGDDQDHSNNNGISRSIGAGRLTGNGVEEVITVHLLPEKEGIFMFQHRNYEVKSARRGSTVVRRYSDFVWLLDCLQKRYPFRQLPLLPPKRVSVNGTHLAANSSAFLEKRRRGLVRFANSLVRHPVLSQEQLVVMFLTVPTELSVWRKQATISVQEEFVGKALPPTLEDSLPPNLPELFDTVRVGVRRSADIYINLCTLLERLAKRNEGLAADHLRFSLALQSLTESTKDTYAVDTNDVPLLNEGITATAKHMSASQSLLEDEAKAWDEGVLEDFKRQRDCLVSMRELFERRDRYAKDNIPQLERRIETNEAKLSELRSRPENAVKPGEIEKVEESIFKDRESIVQQHARGVFIKECIRDELNYFQLSQYHISRLHQDWSQERVKYGELQADNWRSLSEEVEGMPAPE